MSAHRFEIQPRPVSLGGGWRLRLLETEIEVGGGVFPVEEGVSEEDAHADALQTGEDWLRSRSMGSESEGEAFEG
jgi:hypothetical protein